MYDLVDRFTEIETLNKISDILPQMKEFNDLFYQELGNSSYG